MQRDAALGSGRDKGGRFTPKNAEPAAEPPAEPEDKGEAPPAGDAPAISDEAVYKVGEETLTGREIQDRMLMRQAFTKKTQDLAEERKRFDAERDAREDFEVEVKDFFSRMATPEEARYELEAHFPETWRGLVKSVIEEALMLGEATEREQALHHETAEMRLARWKESRAQAREKLMQDRRAMSERRREVSKNILTWRASAMKAAGLDHTNQDHLEAVADAMVSRHRGKVWTRETFDLETARVARVLGVTKKQAPQAPQAPAPPITGPGGGRAQSPDAPVRKAPKSNVSSVFSELRQKYGVV